MRTRVWLICLLGSRFVAPAHLSAQASGEPPVLVSISVNQGTETESERGWPLVVIAQVMHRQMFRGDAQPVHLDASSGSWVDAVRLVVTDSANRPLPWAFQRGGAPSGSLLLDSLTFGEIGWWLPPEQSAGITPGRYHITAYLDSLAVGPPFSGMNRVASVPVELMVRASNPTPSAEETARRHLLFADYFVLKGEDTNALAEVDELLAQQPADVDGWTYRAQLLRAQGELDRSLEAYAAAAKAYFDASPNLTEPPLLLLREYREVQAEIDARTTFEVSVAAKTSLHPTFEQGDRNGYLINGVQGGELWLYEDTTYTFRMLGVPAETPFYFSTGATGNGEAVYTDGVTGHPASGTGEITLTPGAGTPDILFYQSMNNARMGWRIHILRDTESVGVEAPAVTIPVAYHLGSAYPNPFNQQTRFSLTVAEPQRVVVKVLDAEGREVASLYDNPLPGLVPREFVLQGDGLASGAYFIQIRGETFSAVRGVMLVR